ncbi:hypothetical protein BCR42DRAFT_324889 [Absidia repens]|uniref:RPA-interacting protein C-terminal domain-containing protein n=1 Tax=Absidia repens TaxID=90262 RepID=A0A1X2IME6_9FUNG|nr:hypothetical protein BCR42DRAFT_324889 [Absidia repens]
MNSIIAQEWHQFRKDHEMELQQDGVDIYEDLDTLIEDNLQGTAPSSSLDNALYEEYERQQQEEIDTAIAEYESISQPSTQCMKCQQWSSFHQGDCHQCSNCGFTLNKELMDAIDLTIQKHANMCSNRLEFTVEPGESGSIIGLCTACDLWMLV